MELHGHVHRLLPDHRSAAHPAPLCRPPAAVAELEAALAARDAQLAAAQEAQRSSLAVLATRGRSTVGEVGCCVPL